MGGHRFLAAVIVIGLGVVGWAAYPAEAARRSFAGFIVHLGPGLLFSAAVVAYALARRQVAGLWAALFGPLIQLGAFWLFAAGLHWPLLYFASGVLAAWAFLAMTRWLVFRAGSWSDVAAWGSASAIAGVPFLCDARTFDRPVVWAVHILLWWAVVAHGVERMANRSSASAGASELEHAGQRRAAAAERD